MQSSVTNVQGQLVHEYTNYVVVHFWGRNIRDPYSVRLQPFKPPLQANVLA